MMSGTAGANTIVKVLGDSSVKEDLRLKAAQELAETFENNVNCAGYPNFLDGAMKTFLKVLQEGEPHFFSDFNIQQMRKLILEMIHRLPVSEVVRPYVKSILALMLKLLRTDNEDNVIVCLRIIIDLHKQYRPTFHPEIQHFITYVRNIYSDLPKNMNKIFEPRDPMRVADLKEVNLEQLLPEIYTATTIHVDKQDAEGKVTTNSFTLLPRGVNSLKVLQELPIILVLMYQIYKQNVHQEIVEFVPLIMSTITLQPSPVHRSMPNFNREVFVDFMGAQIKALSFLAYIIRTFLAQFQEIINSHAPTMVEGMISLLRSCPIGPASLRKELLVATRHILATDLRNKFINSIDLLFDEDLLLGRGYTSHESLRPLAYSTLADLVHHVRQQLKLDILTKAVYLFSKNVHDESLPTSIQTMSCKLLLNLVDCIRIQRNDETFTSPTPRELLMTMLKVFTLKFHTIAKLQLPLIMQKWKTLSSQPLATSADINKEMIGIDISPETMGKLTSIGFSPPNTLNVCEYRSLVKTLICGVKTITYGINLTDNAQQKVQSQPVTFQPDEVLIFIDLFNWALEALDIYMINIPTPGMPMSNKPITQMPRSKDEKELLEHFSGLFLTMSAQNFQEIFSSTIDFMVDRIAQNVALQVIANSFLASPTTSPLFATVLIEYLLERMEEMGSNIERSNLYLRLFKLVFGSVSLFANENEQMLRPHLHSIVNRSMELAMTAKEPYNYFLLLRALFRSIGGGSHDKLYKEFLPLLPNLLEGLNRLQSGFHKQHMKDLFVELCLTVPVRLSSLLPYLPMLMDPLVSALNGSPTLVNQGLRTLELCVDNLQPDFLYDHIQPVRADLMQALWRTLRNTDSAALVAFRVLGKFGGGNRKMMIEPQRLEYNVKDSPAPAVVAYFQEQRKPIDFPVDKVIETAFNALKTSSTDPFYWAQSWEVIRCYLASSLSLSDEKHMLQKLFTHPSFTEGNIPNISLTQSHFQENQARKTHQIALTAMFVAAATKELRQSVLPTVIDVVRHYTMVAIAQQAGPFPLKHNHTYTSLDPLVLIDALAAIMGHEEKELCKPANFAMVLILKTATDVMGTKERACRLPIMQYLADKMANLCYERPWYAKMGGCIALKFLYEHMSMLWLYQHLYTFLKAYLFVIMDLTGEVSSGAIDMAKLYLENMLNICMVPLDKECKNEELLAIQRKAMFDVTHELVRRITSPHTLVRETAMSSLRQIARLQKTTVTEVMMPHKEVLEDIVPPKKHLLKHQPAGAQIGLMDANTFCTTLEPKLFTLDISIVTHKFFFHEVVTLAEVDDMFLSKLDCFKNITNLIPLRKSALRALAACHYLGHDKKNVKEKIFTILYKALEKNSELQETAFECMQKFDLGCAAEKDFLLQSFRPLLLALGDHRNLTINIVKRLSYLTQLFPSMFNEKLCDQLLEIIKKMLQASVASNKSQNFLKVSKTGETEMKIATIIEIFHQIPAASQKFVPSLIALVLAAEKEIMIEPSSPYRAPLVKFLIRYPEETIDIFMSEGNIKNPQYNRFLIYLMKHKDGEPFKKILENRTDRLVELTLKDKTNHNPNLPEFTKEDENEAQHQGILIIHTLVEMNDSWLQTQVKIVNALKIIWSRELGSCSANENITHDLWHLVAKILLNFFEHNPSNISLLYDLLKVLCMRFIPDFQFLRDFVQNKVCQTYSVEWKRNAFFLFVEKYEDGNVATDLKTKILTTIIIPSFAVSFERDEGNALIGAPPNPYQEDDNNIVSVFINKMIDPEKSMDDDEDPLRIALLQFACLLVERSSAHIHDGGSSQGSKKEGSKLRRLMTFAWPCLLAKNYVDPAARYHGHLLLAHIIARLAINKRIVLQVFHSLLKAHAVEARHVVRQALEVLTPAMPLRMEDGNQMLTHWTKKIILEEGHSMQQLHHILQLIVRHHKVYYPVRHQLVQQMISSMNRLGFSPNGSIDYRKLAVELAEVVVKWELQRIKEETDGVSDDDATSTTEKSGSSGAIKRTIQDDEGRKKQAVGDVPGPSTITATVITPPTRGEEYSRPIDRNQCDSALNFLLKLACQLGDVQPQIPGITTPGETLSRRCVTLIKRVMDPDVWLTTCDLKMQWLDKVFISPEPTQASVGNILTGLELLTFLLGCMRRDQLLVIFRPLQRGLSVCVTSHNPKVIKMMHTLLTKLMSIFPPDHKHDEMDQLYATISKTICDGLTQFEKNPKANPTSLFGTLMILKAACSNNQSYIDRLIVPFMHILDRLKKEHIGPTSQQPPQALQQVPGQTPAPQPAPSHSNTEVTLELLCLSLDLVKNRVIVMGVDLRKMFIGTILVGLIEKSTEPKVIKAIIKMIEEWMKNKNSSVTLLQAPTLREKSILLVKLMHYVEKRFSDDQELNAQFLELVNYIYRDDQLKVSELTSKLEQAFLAGLRCSQPSIRSKFFEVFDGSMRRKLHDRLLYIVCSHSWDSIQHHYWIKQCIELLILTTNTTHSQIKNSNDSHLLPSITSVINLADSEEKNNFVIYTSLQPDQHDMTVLEDKEDAIDMEMSVDTNISRREESERPVENRSAILSKLINRQADFLEASRKVKTEQLLIATAQLCHMDTNLAEAVWLNMFPRLWSILEEGQQQSLDRECVAFLSSGTHVIQKDCHPSALNTFVEAISRCQPPVYIPPSLMTYLGKAHNLWHRMTLMLEDMALEWPNRREPAVSTEYRSEYDFDVELQNEIANSNASGSNGTASIVLEPLSQMYSALYEEDLWAGLWQKYAKYPDTITAINYEQMGYFEEAQSMYDSCMTKFKQDSMSGTITADMNSEILLWENHWIRCTKELNEWNILLEYGQSNRDKHAFLIMDSAWRVPDWNLMKQALLKVEQTSPKQMGHKVSLYRGYLAILNQEEPQHLPSVEKYVEISSALCMREWRRLPPIVSHIHLPILQSAQQIMELQEASQIHQQPLKVPDMKAVVKTWRNRLPVIADDLSHWSDIFTWRQHHYQIITDNMGNSDLGPHASAQTIIQFGKVARKQNLTAVCHNLLSRIHTIPTVPVVDCFQKIRQEVKCFIQIANNTQDQGALAEALEVIETTNIKYFKPELIAEIYVLKGVLLTQMSRSEEANKAFSVSIQLCDSLTKAWATWGDYLESNFSREPRNTSMGISAMTCFLHACRQQNECKSRKYFAKIIWLLTYDESRAEMMDTLEKYGQAIPPIQWLPWIPQLLNCLIQYEGDVIMNLLSNIARSFPQAVYFPIRTLYLMLKIEQRERYKSVEQAMAKNQQQGTDSQAEVSGSVSLSSLGSQPSSQMNSQGAQTIKATPPMYRCSKIMHMQRDIHPTTLSSLEGIVDQMVWFRENWYEEVLRQLRQGLAKCYAVAFDNRGSVNEATITPHTLNFVRKLVSTFGIGIENITTNNTTIVAGSSASESLARRAQATVQDPVFQKLKGQFTSDFDFSQPEATKMQNLISKLKIWIKILDAKTKQLPKSFLIEEKCRFLSNFNQKTAEVDLPGELLLPRHSHYHVKIARFMPRVEIVQKHNTSARRLFIRGTNGKIYPYLVVNDSGLVDARREERVLQLLRMLNSYLTKSKETSKRFLHITVPRVVAVSPQMRLVEDDPSSISLLDILKNYCSRLNIEHDAPISRYYERLAEIQQRGSQTTHVTLRDIFKDIQNNMIPKTVLKDWASRTFNSATDYWTFRKMFTLQLSLCCIIEYAFHLTRLNADMMYLHQDSGLVNVSYFKFDFDDATGELNSSRPVPFRLTPNIVEFLTNIGISGPLQASVIATARCFLQPNFQLSTVLRTILRDEIITIHRKQIMNMKSVDPNEDLSQDKSFSEVNIENVIQIINKGTNQIVERLTVLSNLDHTEGNKMPQLVQLARNPDHLCRMDPSYQPWL